MKGGDWGWGVGGLFSCWASFNSSTVRWLGMGGGWEGVEAKGVGRG